jgi:hypothetical protein
MQGGARDVAAGLSGIGHMLTLDRVREDVNGLYLLLHVQRNLIQALFIA